MYETLQNRLYLVFAKESLNHLLRKWVLLFLVLLVLVSVFLPKDSDFYKKYFDFRDMSNKVNELFKQFAKDNGIETKEYYQRTDRLVIVPTQADRIKFKHRSRMLFQWMEKYA